jgi:hypothetical protein
MTFSSSAKCAEMSRRSRRGKPTRSPDRSRRAHRAAVDQLDQGLVLVIDFPMPMRKFACPWQRHGASAGRVLRRART